MRDNIDLFFSSFDLHIVRGEAPREALLKAAEDYAEVYHTNDNRTILARAASVALKRMEENNEE